LAGGLKNETVKYRLPTVSGGQNSNPDSDTVASRIRLRESPLVANFERSLSSKSENGGEL
jgi:hypothetical protein